MIEVHAASQVSINNPHTLIFFVVAVVCLVFSISVMGGERELSWQRKVYWGGTFGAAAGVFIAFLPSITTGLVLGLLGIFLMALPAYFTTQYIKIGKRVIAFESANDLPEALGDSGVLGIDKPYGSRVTAAKMWWLMVPAVGIIGAGNAWGYVIDRDGLRYGLLGLGIVVVTGVFYGIGDAKKLQRIARGQYVPFAIVSLASAGIFAVCYLAAYSTTRRGTNTRR